MPQRWRSSLLAAVVAVALTSSTSFPLVDARISSSSDSSSSSSFFNNAKVEAARDADSVVLPISPTPSPTSLPPDDCSACCDSAWPSSITSTNRSTSSPPLKLECCTSLPRELFGTKNGECSGLPCCKYSGRIAQSHTPWHPCVLFPTCQSDATKAREFCGAAWTRTFTQAANFTCTDSCCSGPALDSFVWTGLQNAVPGRRDASFMLAITPNDFVDVFYPDKQPKTLMQVMVASPLGYVFTPKTTCRIQKARAAAAAITVQAPLTTTNCVVASYENRTHVTVDLPIAFRTSDAFELLFDAIETPSGVDDSTVATSYAANRNLAPLYFVFDDSEGGVFASFYRVGALGLATLTSGAFVPENIYPGNAGNATLAFYSSARIPNRSTIGLKFATKWQFTADAKWKWDALPDEVHADEADASGHLVAFDDAFEPASTASASLTRSFAQTTYTHDTNWWLLSIDADIEIGWIRLSVDNVQNPSVSYSGLNFATLEIRDPSNRLVVDGTFSAISMDSASGASSSPYNYVTMVVLTCTLLFCTVVIRSNGLAFSLGSIWTDITAICTVLALCCGILNNLVWAFERSSAYFYVSRVYWCLTFTMLTAVCFHWATVLNLRMRKLPKTTTSIAFVLLNVLFYGFQATFLLYHRALISRVYVSEQDTRSYANQQCKRIEDSSMESSASVFSDIQGFLWRCYAGDEDRFFLVSTTVTYAVFLALTLTVMLLGVLVMRRGKLLLTNATGPHQIVLMKALRLYYALIGVVTLVYLLSWIVQLLSRTPQYIPYPWYYVFTVWLPCSIPPSCLIFLQWNATAKSLGDADGYSNSYVDAGLPTSPVSQCGYGEIRTPLFSFSSVDRWSNVDGSIHASEFDDLEEELEDDDDVQRHVAAPPPTSADDFVGLSMALETNESYPLGCFIATQRLEVVDRTTHASVWRQIGNTDTVHAVAKGGSAGGRFVYTFFAVPRIPVTGVDERVRMVVYALNAPTAATATSSIDKHSQHHSEITAETVIAALERRRCHNSSGRLEDDDGRHTAATTSEGESGALALSQRTHASTTSSSYDQLASSRAIDELFENESESDSITDESLVELQNESFHVVSEFTVTTTTLVTAGARCEQVALIASEHSYRPINNGHGQTTMLPPKLSIHTVLPKATDRTKHHGGLMTAGMISGCLAASHSINSQYHIREQGLLVVEDLTESRFSNLIPRQLLEILIRSRAKWLLIAEHDLARLEAYDRQRQKGSDRGIYENLIQQIQDDGDLNRCREWMQARIVRMRAYIALLRRLRRLYVTRDQHHNYFKPSTEKKNALLRFLPINLHLQELWVGPADTFADSQQQRTLQLSDPDQQQQLQNNSEANDAIAAARVYDIVTVGAMAAHVYKFKNGGILALEEQHAKRKPRVREPPGSTAAHHQNPLWTEDEQKTDDLEWDIHQRMDVCFPQAVAALVTAFTRKIDLALQSLDAKAGTTMLHQIEKLGFLFNVESLVSTHGNEAGMLEDMAGAVNELRHVRFVLVDENDDEDDSESDESDESEGDDRADRATTLTFALDDETKRDDAAVAGVSKAALSPSQSGSSGSSGSSNAGIAGVVDVNVFANMDDALAVGSSASRRRRPNAADDATSTLPASAHAPLSSNAHSSHSPRSMASSFSGVGQRLLSTLLKAKHHKLLGGIGGSTASSLAPASVDQLFSYTHVVVRVKVRSSKLVKLTEFLRSGGSVKVCPVLFSQGINEKQSLANNTGSSITRLQDVINENSLRSLRAYCDQYCTYQAILQSKASGKTSSSNTTDVLTRDEVTRTLNKLEKLISLSRQTRKKRPEILQLSSDLCRRVAAGRVTVCKSAKDRTGMSVTLEQGRILVQHHGLPEAKRAGIVAVMRSEGVRIENALKNTGRRVFAFNALQRSLMPEEYRCPPHTGGRNMS